MEEAALAQGDIAVAYNPIKQLQSVPQLPTLRPGQTAWAVRLLRRVLGAWGYGDPAWADPAKTPEVSAEFDGELNQLVRRFQGDHRLAADGIVGQHTWTALSNGSAPEHAPAGAASELRQTIVRIAQGLCELGVREHGGNNRGVVVEAMLKHAGGRPGQPWCMAFVDFVYEWACEMCGVHPLLDPGLSCSALVRQAEAKGLVHEDPSQAQLGDLLVLKGGPTGYKHVGIVESMDVSGRTIICIEGNTRSISGETGDSVYRLIHQAEPKLCCCIRTA